jgi:hypothetical protein
MPTCPDTILRLIERFSLQADQLRSPDYNETQIRIDFINPLMSELGWDIDNRQGFAERYRDVVHEDRVKVSGQTKAPDYSFRVGGQRKFFLEAKKPAVDIAVNVESAYQLRRYAWSAKLACSLLTDFEELAIYDTRIQPRHLEKASKARRELIHYTEYPERWDFLHGTFSKEAVLRGDFDRYCESQKGRGAQAVDDAFLAEIEEWRKALATNLALRNKDLDEASLNFATQRIIDRIVFLRIAEDRGTETVGQLQELLDGQAVYQRLCNLFLKADGRYNSGLFQFSKEKDRNEPPDDLTPTLEIDDTKLKGIIRKLYYPESPYEFTMLSADILGSIYEQFLGKVITLSANHRAKIEEKPEVRKAGGVYYTPTYIVDYIVRNTVGKLLEGKTPREAAKIKVIDPSCGSGSFLIGAYQHLLDWYLEHYTKPPSEPAALARLKRAVLRPSRTGGWALTIAERKRILLDHIHGVDIDDQAVEVTKLNLLLKCLEGETSDTLGFQHRIVNERALPDLGNNIKCGNSLIGTDFIGTPAWNKMTENERRRVNPFDYEKSFPGAFHRRDRKGAKESHGFDVVIGNPPYGAMFSESEKGYLFDRYAAIRGQPESYEYFLHRMVLQLCEAGYGAYIVPTNFVESQRAEGLRRQILSDTSIHAIQNFRYNPWKNNASEPLVIVLQRTPPSPEWQVALTHPATPGDFVQSSGVRRERQIEWASTAGHRFVLRASLALLRRIESTHPRLDDDYDVSQGIIVYKTREQGTANLHIADKPKGKAWVRLLDTNSTVGRYHLHWGGKYLNYGDWLWCPRERRYFESDKIVFTRLRNKSLPRKLVATLDNERFYNRDNFNNIIKKTDRADLVHLLAIFNSKVANYWYKAKFDNVNVNPAQVRQIPVPLPRPEMPIGSLVHRMLSLHKQMSEQRNPSRRVQIEREIDATDKQIDQLVYRLYGLNDDEIGIVEASSAQP